MKVYVDEFPSCCEDCECHNGANGRCKLLHRTTFDMPPRDCPLLSLADYTKQVRKEVCEEIGSEIVQKDSKVEKSTYSDSFVSGYHCCYCDVKQILVQIQGKNI